MSTNTSPHHRLTRRRPSPAVMLLILALVSLVFCIGVYIVPILSGQSIAEAYDAFSYAANMSQDPAFARDLQPFLNIYPAWPGTALFIYALLLHALLIMPAAISLYSSLGRRGFSVILAAIAIPESSMFLGSISKEGLGIVAVVAAMAGQNLVIRGNIVRGALMCVYAIVIAEISRPFYGIPFGVALAIGFFPALPRTTRRIVYMFLAVGIFVIVWAILYGPFAEQFTEKYQAAKQFLDWFEEEMGSGSPVKAATRQFFALAFSSDKPSLTLLLMILIAAIAKAVVYVLAIPLVAPANFSLMPAQAWALTWQVAASFSSVAMVAGLFRLRKCVLDIESKCHLWFGLALMLVISISTAIFHVRYRAPAVVIILATVWSVIPSNRRRLTWMMVPTMCATAVALLATA